MPFFPQFSNLFTPPYIPPAQSEFYAWYKADVGVTHAYDEAKDYDAVTQWNDQSGNGRHLINSANGPEYISNAINGSMPALFFSNNYDGYESQYLELAGDTTTIKSIIAVVLTDTFPQSYQCIVEAAGGGLYTKLGDTNFGSYWATFVTYAGMDTNTNYILGVRTADGIDTYGYQNDSGSIYQEGSGFQPRSKITVGNDATHGQTLIGYVTELMLFDREISDGEMASYISSLNSKWSIF